MAQSTAAADATAGANASAPLTATQYCLQKGGELEYRYPAFNTNADPSQWLTLAGHETFCQFTAPDGSRIHIAVNTLFTKEPSLAAAAYFAKVPLPKNCNGNPASCYCSELGGSDLFGGINFNGGGWVKLGAIDEVLEACIFPDLSSIDSWGLAYHSVGIVRGVNLGKVMRWHGPPKQ